MTFNSPKKASLPPMPNRPEHPERVPSNVPIPGEPTAQGKKHTHEYKCPKCGQVFNSKKELKTHTETAHKKESKK